MSHDADALASATAQVTAVRDDPAARLELMARVFRGPTGRGVLDPLDVSPPGSAWWRAVNERLLRDVERYLADEQRLGRILDFAVIAPRLQDLYEWSASELGEPRLLDLVREGNPIYVWPFEQRHVWRAPAMKLAGRVLERATRPR